MKNTKKIKSSLDKILQSNEFQDSQKYQELLRYLVLASIEGRSPKEITIAHDVFGIDPSQDRSDDTKVRVNIYNLRKKLDSYYLHEGNNDDIQFEIPKGHYRVKFHECSKIKQSSSKWPMLVSINIIFLLMLIAGNYFIISKYFSYPNPGSFISATNPVWGDFLSSDLPVLIVFGDYYLYKDTTIPQQTRYVRDYQINSDQDFQQFLSSNGEQREGFSETSHTLLGKFAPWSISEIYHVFASSGIKPELKLSSNLQWEDITKHNIVFIGTFKTLSLLNELIADRNFRYQISPNTLFYDHPDGDTSYSYTTITQTPESVYETDYAVIAKQPGSASNSILIFASTRDIGCLATVEFLTTPETLFEFAENHLRAEDEARHFFEAVFEVQGYERNVLKTSLLHFNQINSGK